MAAYNCYLSHIYSMVILSDLNTTECKIGLGIQFTGKKIKVEIICKPHQFKACNFYLSSVYQHLCLI